MGNFNQNDRGRERRPFPRRDFDRNRGGNGNRGGRKMFKAICSNCGKSCEVPFQPTNTKPVYCSDCFEKMGGGRKDRQDRSRFDNRRPQRDNRGGGSSGANFNEQLDKLSKKLDRIISLLDPQAKEQKPQQPLQVKEDVKPQTKSVKVVEPTKEEIVFMQQDSTQTPVVTADVAEAPVKEEKPKKTSTKKAVIKKSPKSKK